MIVHLCCSVDAGYFLKRLQEEFAQEKIIGFFYDPNIHPYLEFKLRSLDTQRICEKLGVEFVEGDYDYENWLKVVKGKENEAEKGARCSLCFDHSLKATAEYAKKRNNKTITTSLLMSPMKSQEQLNSIAKIIKEKYDIDFYAPDFRKKGGTQAQQIYAKQTQMYRQDYCGCMYGLWLQKKNKEIIDELLSPITKQTLPSSIEEKLEIYKKRLEYEKKGVQYKIIKENFLNYRLFRGSVKLRMENGELRMENVSEMNSTYIFEKSMCRGKWKIVPSYILFYSYLQRSVRGKIEFIKDEVGYFSKMQIIFVSVEKFNKVLNKSYKNVKEILLSPPNIDEELKFREYISSVKYSLSPIIVIDKIENIKYEIDIEAKIYPDVREILIKF